MAINKNAVLRYNVLDKCFQNFGRKYYFQDLLDVVNEALLDENPLSTGVQTRQLRDDIRFMKSDAGYAAPIESYRDGKKAFYRYSNKDFSINKQPLNATEAEQLKSAIAILQRFEGSPEFEWVNEMGPMLKDQFGLKDQDKKVMGYDANIDYSGYEYITTLFNAITNKRVLNINYKPFTGEEFSLEFHPYYLKQFNNRWFVYGRNDFLDVATWNLALDRIISIKEVDKNYIEDKTDWEDFFYDIIGVSKPIDGEVELIELLFAKEQAPYIQTKPLHPSQKSTLNEDGSLSVTIKVVINYELEMKLLGFADKVIILSPKNLKHKIKDRLFNAVNNY